MKLLSQNFTIDPNQDRFIFGASQLNLMCLYDFPVITSNGNVEEDFFS